MSEFIDTLGAESNYFICDENDGKFFFSTDRSPGFLYSKMLPYKYLSVDMDRVLGLDVDALVIGDISELYYGDFCDNYVVGCHNRRTSNNLFEKHDDAANYRDGFKGGVIIYNLDLMRREITFHTYRQWFEGYLLTGKKLEQFEERVMANTMRGRSKLMMPWGYCNHFIKDESDTITTTPFYCYYELWWSYARQSPEKILSAF